MTEKLSCDSILFGGECPDECPGLLASRVIRGYGDGVEVQICPKPSAIGTSSTEIDHNGSGADVMIVHAATVPSEEDFTKLANSFGQ